MAVATILALLATACNEVLDRIATADDSRLITQSGGILVSLSVELCKTVEEMGIFAFLRKSNCDALYGHVMFNRAE